MAVQWSRASYWKVALRKESVDRNLIAAIMGDTDSRSLSARRAWIEIVGSRAAQVDYLSRSPQGERG